MGFERKSAKPFFMNISLTPFTALAVRATTGVFLFLPYPNLIFSAVSTPSISGIIWSMKIISKGVFSAILMASDPLGAVHMVIS